MKIAIRIAALVLLGLFLHAMSGITANAATARPAATAVTCAQTVASNEMIETAHSVVADETNDIADCQSGNCRGSSCHCACHGVVGGLPSTFASTLSLTTATNYPRPFAAVASRHPSPPVRPPRA